MQIYSVNNNYVSTAKSDGQIYSVNNNYVSTAKSNGHLTLTAVFPADTSTKPDIITLYSATIFKPGFLQITIFQNL